MRPSSLLLLVALGCAGDETGTEPDPVCTPAAHLGGAGVAFTSLSEGDPVVMVHGPQGGWHVECGVRFEGLGTPIDLHWWIDDLGTGVRVSESWLTVQPWSVADDPCAGDFTGMYGFLDVDELAEGELDSPPELLVGAELSIALEATGTEGSATAEVVVLAEPDPADVER
jgi:hypothetical protein